MTEHVILGDRVLATTRPALPTAEAADLAAALFGVPADAAVDLGSERDRTFALLDVAGEAIAILKVSNPSEDPRVLDMEAAAALHILAVDPGLRVALPWRPATSGEPGAARSGDRAEDLRAQWWSDDVPHWVRLYDVLPGASRIDAAQLSDDALRAWGETAARLGLALRGFSHPCAQRRMLWDVQHALAVRPMLADIRDERARGLVERVLHQFEQHVTPVWPRLRAQALHGDLTVDNTLTDERGLITGIVDFGDMSHTALVTDLASVLDSLGAGRDSADLVRMARLVLDGYQRHVELEELELAVLGTLWAARSAVTIAISSWRVAHGLEEQAFAERYNRECRQMLEALEAIGPEQVARELGARGPGTALASLADRRSAVFGPAMEPLFYDVPIEAESAQGVWITAADGRRYLDVYNNVASVGHCHPRVASAIARQARRLNTHMRYLHPAAIELAERLVALAPPGLDTVLLVNSGSEANDLAWRMACAATGHRAGLCTDYAYHGITEATAALSPEGWLDGVRPAHVETWTPPNSYRATALDGASFAAALDRLQARGLRPAAAILDPLLMSDGIENLGPEYVPDLIGQVRRAGGMWIADEVQSGHGRTGEAMWAIDRYGVAPDFLTLGKPMGNGHPVAAVVTRREIAEAVAGHTTLFSTFGGNPVSAVAALAVLDVIEDERVLEHVRDVGMALRDALEAVAADHEAVGDVRGVGLAWGVELVADRADRRPDGERAGAVRDRLRHHGVLVGTTGRAGNVLKLRPPLAFDREHIPLLTDALRAALRDAGA